MYKRQQPPRLFASKLRAEWGLRKNRHRIRSKGFTSLAIHKHESGVWFIRDEKTGYILNRDNVMQYYINPIKPYDQGTGQEEEK